MRGPTVPCAFRGGWIGLAAATLAIVAVFGGAEVPPPAYGRQSDVSLLESTPWTLITYVDLAGATQRVLANAEIVAQFDGGNVSGSAGCNSYTSAYETAGDQISFSGVATTLRVCAAPAVMEQEQTYLAALQKTATFAVDATALTLHDPAGAVLLTYVPQPQTPLERGVWVAVDYNNGRGAVTSLIIGTRITARFAGGDLVGSGGCNAYTAPYALNGHAISIGPAASTQMTCSDPTGIMEQEVAYLAALPTARVYRIDGNRLILETADGARVASFLGR